MKQEIIKNSEDLKVMTPTGYKTFSGMSKTWHEKIVEITTASRKIKCGLKHKFLCDLGWVDAEKIETGMSLTTINGKDDIVFSVKIKNEPQWLYDLIDVDGGNAYITNGVISHNCEFISSDAMLIDSIKLMRITPKQPVAEEMGFKFWTTDIGGYGKTYLVGVDPSTGNNNDFTVIEVFEFPSLFQVAELRLNNVNIPLIYSKLKWLLNRLREKGKDGKRAEVVWSFERNGVGEGLVVMIQNDDSPTGGVYMDGVELYNENPTRLGVYTTGKSKLIACMQLKNLVEKISGGLQINSELLQFELKNFIAAGGTYQAKLGATDDAVMATLVVIKLIHRLSTYDDSAREMMYGEVSPDADLQRPQDDPFGDEPVPFTFV